MKLTWRHYVVGYLLLTVLTVLCYWYQIDARVSWHPNVMANYLDAPLLEIRKKIMQHPMCPKCKAKGISRYTEIYSDPSEDDNPVAKANQGKYR